MERCPSVQPPPCVSKHPSAELGDMQGMDFPMYMYKPRRGMKRGEESKETYKLPHRLIEKKRRDRINECIAQLKDLLPEHLKLTTLGHLEKAVVLELTLKHVKALTTLLEQQQQKILALQNGMQIDHAVSQDNSEEMFRSGFHMCAKEVLQYLANQEAADGDLTPAHMIGHLHKVAAEVLQGPAPAHPAAPSPRPADDQHHHHHHHHHHHQPHNNNNNNNNNKESASKSAAGGMMMPPKPSDEGHGKNCVPVIQRAYALAGAGAGSGEQSGSDTDTDSGYGGEGHEKGRESELKRALGGGGVGGERAAAGVKQEEDEPCRKRARAESSEDESLSGGESSSSSSSSSSGHSSGYMSFSSPHHHHQAPPPLCMPFYLIPPSAAAYLPMLEKCWYQGAVPMIYPGLGQQQQGQQQQQGMPPGSESRLSPGSHLMMSPRGGRSSSSPAPPPPSSSSQTPMDSPALLQALKQVLPMNLETKEH